MIGEPSFCQVYVGAPFVEAVHVNVTVSPAFGVVVPVVSASVGFS